MFFPADGPVVEAALGSSFLLLYSYAQREKYVMLISCSVSYVGSTIIIS